MNIISTKILVGLGNIFLYLILVLLFLTFGYDNFGLNHETINNLSFGLFSIAILFFISYQFLRKWELSKTEFQLTKKHIVYNWIFYITQYFVFLIVFIYIFLLRYHVVLGLGTRVYFFVFFPIIFIATIVSSVLESIIRVEDKIFTIKKKWKLSAEYEKQQQALKTDNQKTVVTKDKNPFAIDKAKEINKKNINNNKTNKKRNDNDFK